MGKFLAGIISIVIIGFVALQLYRTGFANALFPVPDPRRLVRHYSKQLRCRAHLLREEAVQRKDWNQC